MEWLLRDQGTPYPATPPDHIERRLWFALARFCDRAGTRIGHTLSFQIGRLRDRRLQA